jgi:hypothetical protein
MLPPHSQLQQHWGQRAWRSWPSQLQAQAEDCAAARVQELHCPLQRCGSQQQVLWAAALRSEQLQRSAAQREPSRPNRRGQQR